MKIKKLYFTPCQATRTLPLVKRVVADILRKGQQWKKLASQSEDYHSHEAELDIAELKAAIAEHIDELQQIGCSFRDLSFEIGLVDFPAKIEGQEVLLCWKSDEQKLEWYHGLHAGFAGRRRIPKALLVEPDAANS
jgi:hypothetical protein